MEVYAMEVKIVCIKGKCYKISSKKLTHDQLEITIENEQQETKKNSIKIKKWNVENKTLLFELNNQLYKTKAFFKNGSIDATFIFNSSSFFPVKELSEVTPAYHKPTHAPEATSTLKAPLGGRVIKILVEPGQQIIKNQPLIIIESMKMENEICAHCDTIIKTLPIKVGDLVQPNQVLVIFEKEGEKGNHNATPKRTDEPKEITNR